MGLTEDWVFSANKTLKKYVISAKAEMTFLLRCAVKRQVQPLVKSDSLFFPAPILKSPGCAHGIHRALSDRRLRHSPPFLPPDDNRRRVGVVGMLGRGGAVLLHFKGVSGFSFAPAKER